MRLCRFLFVLVIVSALPKAVSAQQWNGGSDAASAIHRLGEVGIGLTSPAYPLDVSGVIQADTLMIGGTVGLALSATSVYVGTASPFSTGAYSVAIGGNALRSNTTGSSNTGVGYRSLEFNTDGARNTALGDGSLRQNTIGVDNTALGYAALYSNTTGEDNTAVGRSALNYNTSGKNNTAVGASTLNANTTGADNTAVGSEALRANTTGAANMAVGKRALYSNTGGNYNTAFGYRSLYSNLTGSNNVALGYQTLYGNTTGSINVAIGQDALYQNTSGDYNIAIGREALKQNTTGTYNVALGFSALTSNTTGSSNTAIGPGTLVANTTGHNTTAIGNEALRFNTIGTGNVGVGYRALYTNTTGSSNTSVGRTALYKNTTGSQNTSVGFGSLYENTTGANNAALGHRALHANTGGNDNTAVGYEALVANTTGVQNTAVGRSALHANTTASENTAVGYGALVANTTGERNTALGRAALYTNSTGERNTALGYSSLYYNTTGIRNTAVGFSALEQNTTGGSNTAVGYGAGRGLQQGSTNTLIGYQAGDTLTTGSNNIIIGYGMDAPTTDASDHLNIGNTLYGDLASGEVGIGTPTPSNLLHLHGTDNYVRFTDTDAATGARIGLNGSELFLDNQEASAIVMRTNNFEAMRIDASSNVGIGTTTPGYKLDVVGTINATEILVGGQPISTAGSWGTTNNDLHYTAGNVSIGTATSASKFTINQSTTDATNEVLTLTNQLGNANDAVSLRFNAGGGASGTFLKHLRQGTQGGDFAIFTAPTLTGASTERFRITNNGNVGIGTAAPNYKLSVAGSVEGDNYRIGGAESSFIGKLGNNGSGVVELETEGIRDIQMGGATGGTALYIDTSERNVGIGTNTPSKQLHVATNAHIGNLQIEDSDVGGAGTGRTLWSSNTEIGLNNYYGNILFKTGESAAPQERMRIAGNGNVGIGVTDPQVALDIAGTIHARNDASSDFYALQLRRGEASVSYPALFSETTNGTLILAGDGSGNGTVALSQRVGVGITNPIDFDQNGWNGQLVVAGGTGSGGIVIQGGATSTLNALRFGTAGSHMNADKGFVSYDLANDKMTFGTNRGGRLIIDASGNVGIGTANPSSKLAVDGTITSKEVVITMDPVAWPDYVFEEDYNLRSLNEVGQFVEENGHLPEVPSAEAVGESGVAVGDMQATLLKKIEELTLYLLEQQKTIAHLQERLEKLEQ